MNYCTSGANACVYSRSVRLACGKQASDATEVRALSLNRLLKETVTRADYVVLKVDVEASEYELLGCLTRSPSLQ